MKDVALIISNNPFLINEKVFPNIGVLRIATQLKNAGYSVDVLDFTGKSSEEIKQYANDYKYFGFSSTTPQFPYVMKLFKELKQENPQAKTIIGGAHPSALYYLKQKGIEDININDLEVFDTIFVGEGEDITNLFKPGWQKGNLIKNLDDILIPNRDFINIKSYHYNLFDKDTTCIITQRGCPYQCAFCSGRDVEMYNKIRYHSPKRILEEMDELNEKYGYTSFMWYDDEINLNINRLEQLCKELTKRNYQHRGFVRSDMIVKHSESVKWLKDAGFVKLCAGVESGSNRMLKNINKGITVEQNSKARQIIKDARIHYEAFMMLGFPDETLEDVMMTKQWLIDNKPDDFDLNLITPYPGSKIYDDAIPSKKFADYKWEYRGMFFNKPRYAIEDSYYKGINRQSYSNVRTNELSNEDLKKLRDEIDEEIRKCIK
jgi:anaerobic magnesium-protoporphyrin IX monomethyl ester cyclase